MSWLLVVGDVNNIIVINLCTAVPVLHTTPTCAVDGHHGGVDGLDQLDVPRLLPMSQVRC